MLPTIYQEDVSIRAWELIPVCAVLLCIARAIQRLVWTARATPAMALLYAIAVFMWQTK